MKRYAQFAQLINKNGTKALSGLPFVDFLYDGNVVYHKVEYSESGRLDLIAYKKLGDPSLWYPIALLNNIFDPIADVVPGLELAIPIDLIDSTDFKAFTFPGTK